MCRTKITRKTNNNLSLLFFPVSSSYRRARISRHCTQGFRFFFFCWVVSSVCVYIFCVTFALCIFIYHSIDVLVYLQWCCVKNHWPLSAESDIRIRWEFVYLCVFVCAFESERKYIFLCQVY